MDGSAVAELGQTGATWVGSARAPEFRLLGHLAVGDGRGSAALGGPKQRAMLAYLLLHAGEVVTTERLVDAIWGDDPPPTASAIVYGYIRKLRAALETSSARLSTRSSGYVMEIPGGSLDVALFERLHGQGREALRTGDAALARRLLSDALALWRGQALDGLDGEGFLHAEQARLESLHLSATLGRIDADLRVGEAAEVVDELAALASDHPLDEGIRGQLMLALYRSGNQAAALATYHDIRRTLADELGLDPSRGLADLEGAILRQDPALDLPGFGVDRRSSDRGPRLAAAGLHLVEAVDVCPFMGLASFGLRDADRFFGRERLVADMVTRLSDHSFLAVVGPSGSGKSSVVRAGLLPALGGSGGPGDAPWIRVILRPGAEPMRELDRVVFAALDESQRAALPAGVGPLPGAAAVLGDDLRLCVVVDQFEEAFTLADPGQRTAFITSLVDAARAGSAAVVIVIRADFYGRCAEDAALAGLVAASQVLVGTMGPDEYRRAIEGPATQAGLRMEPELVERLVAEVEDEPGGLPLLSTALVELWQRRDGRTIPRSALAATGGVRGAVGRLAENAFGQLTDSERATARIAFLRLAAGDGEETARRRVPLAEFDAAPAGDMQRTLAVLTNARLLTMDRGTVEVAHEALFREWPRLVAWLDEDRESRRTRAHLTAAAREWDGSGRPATELYRGTRLAAVLDWSADHGEELNELERQFVAASREAGEEEVRRQRLINRRLRLLLVGMVIGLILAVSAGAVALVQRADAQRASTAADQARATADAERVAAERAADTADAERLGAQALVAKALDVSLLLARQGLAIDDSAATRANLLAALERSPAAIGISRPLPGRPLEVWASDDGRTLLVRNNGRESAVIDAATGKTRFTYDWPSQVIDVYLDGNGDLVVLNDGPHLILLSPSDGSQLGTIDYPPNNAFRVDWSPDLRTIGLTSPDDRSIEILDATTDRLLRTLVAPAGTWIADVVMDAGGHVLAPLIPGSFPADPDAALGQPGRMAFAWWGADSSRPLPTPSLSTSASRGDVSYTVSPDLQTLMLGNVPGSGQGTLVDLGDGSHRTLQGQHSASILGATFSPDGGLVATGGDDLAARLWDARTGDLVQTFLGHSGRVFAPAFVRANDKLTMYTVSLDGTMMAWDVTGSRRLGEPFVAGTGLGSVIASADPDPRVAVSPDGRLLAANQDGGVVILDATTHAVVRQIATAEPGGASDMAWSPNGSRFAVTGIGTGIVELFNTATWQSVRGPLPGPPPDRPARPNEVQPNDPTDTGRRINVARTVAFSPDSRTVVAGTDDGRVWSWNAQTGDPLSDPIQVTGPVYDVTYNPVSGWLAVVYNSPVPGQRGGGSGLAAVFAPGESAPRYTVSVDDDYGRAEAAAFRPDGTLLATGGGTGDVRFWAADTGIEVGRRVTASAGVVLDLAWSPSGVTLVSTGTDGTVRLIDADARTVAGVLPGPENSEVDAVVAPAGTRLYVLDTTGQGDAWSIDPMDWADHACAVASRTLTSAEWDQYLPNRPYQPACAP